MCGIFGAISANPLRDVEFRRFIQNLAVASEARGKDASGFCGFSNGEILTDKSPRRMMEFLRESLAFRQLIFKDNYTLIGHTRAATNGNPKDIGNNHPFHSDKYALVHNGVIYGYEYFAKELGAELKTKCDSEILLHFVNDSKALSTGIKNIYKTVEDWGSYAVAILNKENGAMTLFRSMSVPLQLGFVPRWNAWVFVSTMEILIGAIRSTFNVGEKSQIVKEITSAFEQIPDGVMHTISPEDLSITKKKMINEGAKDLYKVLADKRALKEKIFKAGVSTDYIMRICKKMRKVATFNELNALDKTIYKRMSTLPANTKLCLWKNNSAKIALRMTEGEYKAFMEFCDV